MEQLINQNITNLKPSATLAINERSNALVSQGKKIYKLGFGQSPFPVPERVVKSLQDHAHQKDYLPVRGLTALRNSVAGYYRRKFAIDCSTEDVLIGPGSKELLFLVQMIYRGQLLLPQPSWVSYEPQAQLASKPCAWLPTRAENGYLLEASTLDHFCRQQPDQNRILILNYPSNPTGSTLNSEQLTAIAEVARKHRLLILSDEIYGDTHHDGKHESMAAYYSEGTIVSSGLSKWCGAGGWRLGNFVFPPALRWLSDKMAVAASETFTSTSAPIQYAATEAYNGGKEIEEYLSASRKVLKRIALASSQLLSKSDISHPQPEGGFYLMPDFSAYRPSLQARNIFSSEQLCEQLLEETGVALLPLSAFGMFPDFMGARLSYVDFDGGRALQLIREKPEASAEELAPKVVEGIQKLTKWLNQKPM